jgi:hypothetical protein
LLQRLQAADVLSVDSNILRCAILDDAGRVISYAESEKGREENLPKDSSLMINVLVRQSLLDSLPKQLGKVKFNVVVTDKYRLIGQVLGNNTIMFALPLNTIPDDICDKIIRKFA